MAGKIKNKVEGELGCGFVSRIFQLKSYKLRKSSVHSLPIKSSNNVHSNQSKMEPKKSPNQESKVSTEIAHTGEPHKLNVAQKPARKSTSVQIQRLSNAARSSTSSSTASSTSTHTTKVQFQPLTGNLLVNNNSPRITTAKTPGCVPKNNKELINSMPCKGLLMGNIMRKNSDELAQFRSPRNRVVDPEMLKSMGNEAYKKGKFEEALGFYDRAIAIDSNKATYHCNKSAALIGLGKLLEAIVECQESIRLDPSYNRAHHRLATIYFRLGEAEKALNCNHTTSYGDSVLAFQVQTLQNHLNKCVEARKVNEWNVILKETRCAISLGADQAPQVYALQTEALLKLLRHQEACNTFEKMPNFAIDWCNKILDLARSAYLLMIGAQVYLAAGRFEDAMTAAQQAANIDASNKEVNEVLRRVRAVTSARNSGNLLFKASKFMEACVVYNEGLEHDSHNSVLLCNRAACRSKLGQFEKAIEDCNAALVVQPCYSKARLRRAYCNAKLERWEAAIQDYEMLIREKPGDEEVAKALFEARLQLKMLSGEDIKDLKFGSNLVFISSNDRFRYYVTSPGMSVVLFSNKATHKQVLLVLEQTSKRFPSVNFLKVEIEDHPYLAKSEGVSSVPAFKIYKNGARVKEISGNHHELLERSVELYSS